MCTYSQLKKMQTNYVQPPPPRGSMALLLSQNCTRLAEKISKDVLKVEA